MFSAPKSSKFFTTLEWEKGGLLYLSQFKWAQEYFTDTNIAEQTSRNIPGLMCAPNQYPNVRVCRTLKLTVLFFLYSNVHTAHCTIYVHEVQICALVTLKLTFLLLIRGGLG